MALEYLNQHDAEMRLNNTICMYGDAPVLVQVRSDHPANHIMITRLGSRGSKPMEINVGDTKFSVVPPEVGYLNYKGRTYYITRAPERRQRQGLSFQSLRSPSLMAEYGDSFFNTGAMRNMLLNSYPSLEECIAHVSTDDGKEGVGAPSLAFHKHMKISVVGNQIALSYADQPLCFWDHAQQLFYFLRNDKTESFYRPELMKHGVPL